MIIFRGEEGFAPTGFLGLKHFLPPHATSTRVDAKKRGFNNQGSPFGISQLADSCFMEM